MKTGTRLVLWQSGSLKTSCVPVSTPRMCTLAIKAVKQWRGSAVHRVSSSLHQSDECCGSYLTVDDAAETLEVPPTALETLATKVYGQALISELDVIKAWGSGKSTKPTESQRGKRGYGASTSLSSESSSESRYPIVMLNVRFPLAGFELAFSINGRRVFVENCLDPSHFIPQYQRVPDVAARTTKREVEDHFGCNCIVQPFWSGTVSRSISHSH